MKVGFVLECYEDGADHQVLKFLVEQLRPDVKPVFVYMGSKGELFRKCREKVAGLLDIERCKRVFVVWDLIPPEVRTGRMKPCRAEREAILAKLREEDRDRQRTTLLCISHELEAWLLADETAIQKYLYEKKAKTHEKPVDAIKYPERDPNPKRTLNQIFQEHRGRNFEYSDVDHALELVRRARLSKYEDAPSFARLKRKLEALGQPDETR